MDLSLRQAARAASERAYLDALRDLPDAALKREFSILAHAPELREVLEAEVARRLPRGMSANA